MNKTPLALVLVAAIVLPSVSATEKWDACDIAVAGAKADFDQYQLRGLPVPEYMVLADLPGIGVACRNVTTLDDGAVEQVTGTATAILDDAGGIDLKKICSGGGSTVTGWENEVVLLGTPYGVARGPASSHYTFSKTDSGKMIAEGHARSLLDDVEWTYNYVRDGQIVFWQFAGLPMKGDAQVDPRCTGPIVTSVDTWAQGSPEGVGKYIVMVRSSGTTCLIPC